ncbi:MAG: hypothetical protein ACFFCS_06535 [Candidatus Hodarchaeota archaeon]
MMKKNIIHAKGSKNNLSMEDVKNLRYLSEENGINLEKNEIGDFKIFISNICDDLYSKLYGAREKKKPSEIKR